MKLITTGYILLTVKMVYFAIILEFILKLFYIAITSVFHELRYRYLADRKTHPEKEDDVAGKVVVITGGSRGIGKASAMELAKRNAIVVLGCVDMGEGLESVKDIKEKTGNPRIEAIYLDLSDMDNVERFAKEVAEKYPDIKILINNAGICGSHEIWAKKKTREGFNITMAVNHLGHFLLTNLLLENLKRAKCARIVSMSSSTQFLSKLDIDDLMMDKSGFGVLDLLPYHNSKFATALFIRELGKRIERTGVTTYALCPWVVRTELLSSLTGFAKFISDYVLMFHSFSKEEAASEFVMFCALDKSIGNETGFMYRFKKHFREVNNTLHPDLCSKLWEVSATLVRLDERLQRINFESETAKL